MVCKDGFEFYCGVVCKVSFIILRWYGTLEYGDFHEKFNFFTIQDLRPLNTCQKHFEMILPNFPLDECEI